MLTAVLMSGCVTTHQRQINELNRTRPNPQVLLMPLDVELSELSAGGMQQPKAEWTAAARQHMLKALRDYKQAKGMHLVEYDASTGAAKADADKHTQLIKLHRAVGRATVMHQLIGQMWNLPSKNGKMDWTLGPQVAALKQDSSADYALFIYVRDSYTSPERVAAIVVGALLGVAVHGGIQYGFATLVDLESGNIVWINRIGRESGDLRTAEPAVETIATLLEGFPK